MSLGCGACRRTIFKGFVILYRLERDEHGNLLLPDKEGKDYVPHNSSICEVCLKNLPLPERKKSAEEVMKDGEEVFAFSEADSTSGIGGSKTWSGITTNETGLVFVKAEVVHRLFPLAVKIIDEMDERRRLNR